MKRALSLAKKGQGKTNSNPLVGAVIINQGHIVGEAFHRKAGGPHAEILALHKAGTRARGGVLFVTLEPCCHTNKRTPPCVPFLVQSGLQRVCVAMVDPNPKVKGKGIQALKRAGIEVNVGVLEQEARRLNVAYCNWITSGRPLVILKGAMTLDGKIATPTGHSRWVTGERARLDVHQVRSQVDAIMVGIGTILSDDPELSARGNFPKGRERMGRQPIRIIVDSHLRIPLKAKVLHWLLEQPTILCTTSGASKKKVEQIRAKGANVWIVPSRQGRVSLKACLSRAGGEGITSVLLEGGGTLNAAMLQQGLVNQVRLYVAPRVLGGQDARGLIGGKSPMKINQAWAVDQMKVIQLGSDWLMTGDIGST